MFETLFKALGEPTRLKIIRLLVPVNYVFVILRKLCRLVNREYLSTLRF
jgi:DNA-binding transcriptional ArsR family regulator